jgi:predicted ribonuclease YlaK
MNDLLNENKILHTITGVAGSGKSLITLATAHKYLEMGKVASITYILNPVTAKGTESIGFRKGSTIEKLLDMAPLLRYRYDHIDRANELVYHGILRLIASCDIRGVDLRDTFIIVTEAQNLTVDTSKLILTRVGEGARIILEGDLEAQVDKPIYSQSPGLKTIRDKFNFEWCSHHHLTECKRSIIANAAVTLL